MEVLWGGRVEVSLAVVVFVLHTPRSVVARISSTVRGELGRLLYAFFNVELVTKLCHACVGQ